MPNPRYAPLGVTFVATASTPTFWSGILYGGVSVPTVTHDSLNPLGKPSPEPKFWMQTPRTAAIVPSSSTAASISTRLSREWVAEIICS